MSPEPGTKFLLRPAATGDVHELAAYIRKDSPETAERFLNAAEETFAVLSRSPQLGEACTFRTSRLARMRVWPVKDFHKILVFYCPLEDGVEVIRVLPGARDFAALFSE